MRTLPAAAISAGCVVRLDGLDVTVRRVRNADPVAGRIVWETEEGAEVGVGAADLVEIISL